jgi:hypothetical protein
MNSEGRTTTSGTPFARGAAVFSYATAVRPDIAAEPPNAGAHSTTTTWARASLAAVAAHIPGVPVEDDDSDRRTTAPTYASARHVGNLAELGSRVTLLGS